MHSAKAQVRQMLGWGWGGVHSAKAQVRQMLGWGGGVGVHSAKAQVRQMLGWGGGGGAFCQSSGKIERWGGGRRCILPKSR